MITGAADWCKQGAGRSAQHQEPQESLHGILPFDRIVGSLCHKTADAAARYLGSGQMRRNAAVGLGIGE
jgi:hypothetical protein